MGCAAKPPWLSPQLLMNVPMLATQCGGRSLDVLAQPVPLQAGSVRCSRTQITPDRPCASYGSKKKQSQTYDYDVSQQALHVSGTQFNLRENTCLRKDLRHVTELMTCRSYSCVEPSERGVRSQRIGSPMHSLLQALTALTRRSRQERHCATSCPQSDSYYRTRRPLHLSSTAHQTRRPESSGPGVEPALRALQLPAHN